MIRELSSGRPAFALETERTTYAFRMLPTGQPEQLYFGKKITLPDETALDALTEKRAFAPGNSISYDAEHPELSLEDVRLEFSAPGKGDLREPMLETVCSGGVRTGDFVYLSHAVDSEQPPQSPLPGSCAENAEHLRVTYRDGASGLELETHYYVYADCDCVSRRCVLKNGSDAPVEIERLLSAQLDLPRVGLAVTSFRGAWAREMEKFTVALLAGKYTVESRGGSSSSRCNPFFIVHDPAATEEAGDCWGFNLIYSGDHYSAVEAGVFGKTRVVTGIQPQGFRWLLEPGGSFETPEAVMSYACDGFSGLSRNMHFFVREHVVRGRWKNKARPVLLNSWEACYFNISESGLVSLAKAGRDVGIELFVMDDGWFGERSDDTRSLGDWEPNKKKLPGGLAGLARKIKALGMGFGIWVEPEMVSVNSRLYESHPDWAMAIPGRAHSEGRNQRLLDLANPAVQDFLIEKMTEVFSSAEISYVKWDFNRNFSDVFSPYLPAERQGETAHRYVLGLYRVMAALTERFPDILFEGCASGGNRFDLGVLSYFPQIWASDDTDAIERADIQEGYSYGYPQSVVGAHVSSCPNHQTLRDTPLETRFNVAAFGLLGYEYDIRDLSPALRGRLKEQIETYKKWRDVLQFGRFYRVRGGNEREWCCVSADGKRAVGLTLRTLARPNDPHGVFFARGLDEDTVYRFYNVPRPVDVKRFGTLINAVAPIHVRQDSIVHDIVAKVVKMPGETEDAKVSGALLMNAGMELAPAFAATGFDERVRFYPDFASRLYFMEAVEE
ncbi:MAG: alpha-galactosidase [Oscillospiraceae bacterium]|nr:alpha-galactosidase [Oscillospiraceae bacterium]